MIEKGALVVVYLINPREKYWGRLTQLSGVGAELRGLELSMVETWARELGSVAEDTASLGPASVFFPMSRVEKIFLDEDVGLVPSVRRNLESIAGRDLEPFL